MTQILPNGKLKKLDGSVVSYKEGGWYDGRRVMGGKLLSPGEYEPGKMTSAETIAQTNPDNVAFVQGRIKANQISQPTVTPTIARRSATQSGLQAQVDKARKALQRNLSQRMEKNDAQIKSARETEQKALTQVKEITTPFREDLEKSERERLGVEKNFEENQKLVDELEGLLDESNAIIRQQEQETGLASIRNPRVQKTIQDVSARVGVIEAVINARNGQIAQATNLIDRTVNSINQDRQQQLNYYQTVLNLANRDLLLADEDNKRIAQEQTDILKTELQQSQITANYVKELMINPATAAIIGQAGVSLTDSVEVINTKISQAQYTQEVAEKTNQFTAQGATPIMSPAGVPASRLRSFTDSRGEVHYYKLPPESSTVGYTSSSAANSYLNSSAGLSVDPVLDVIPDATGAYSDQVQKEIDITSIFQDVVFGKEKSESAKLRN